PRKTRQRTEEESRDVGYQITIQIRAPKTCQSHARPTLLGQQRNGQPRSARQFRQGISARAKRLSGPAAELSPELFAYSPAPSSTAQPYKPPESLRQELTSKTKYFEYRLAA